MVERRISLRYRTNRQAKIVLDNGTMDCLVHDISASGVRIEVPQGRDLPEKFLLKIEGMSERRRCRVAWRHDKMIGVEYL